MVAWKSWRRCGNTTIHIPTNWPFTKTPASQPRPPYVIPPGESSVKVAPRVVLSLGGTLEGNARAQAEGWEKIVAFFKHGNKN